MKEDLIKSLQFSKNYFETLWDYDPDLFASDDEIDHYNWVIGKLQDLGEIYYPNYLAKIIEHQNELPYEKINFLSSEENNFKNFKI